MKKLITVFIACWLCISSLPVAASTNETEITVLGVVLQDGDPLKAKEYLEDLSEKWNFAVGSTNPTGVTVKVANAGMPMPMNGTLLDFDIAIQTALATADSRIPAMRDTFGADIIIFFTGVKGDCGIGPNLLWLVGGPFVPDENGLDLRANGYNPLEVFGWTATVDTMDSACRDREDLALHELGHLLGGGHEIGAGSYLHPDTHAMKISGFFVNIHSVLVRTSAVTPQSIPNHFFSNISGVFDNIGTFFETGKSLANYWINPNPPPPPPPPPPSCSLSTPVNVIGSLLGVCDPSPWTRHSVSWTDTCPSANTHYQVWAEQPTGSGYVYAWDTFIPETPVYVTGASANIKAAACYGLFCTGKSTSTYFALSVCLN